MFVLGISGSPRKDGNNDRLLNAALKGAEAEGAKIKKHYLFESLSSGCIACGYCNVHGTCQFSDDISDLYKIFEEADAVIMSSPVYFENVTSWMKTFIDRGQFLWTKDQTLKSRPKLGLFISAAARLNTDFSCIEKTMKVFFISAGVLQVPSLLYSGFEELGSIEDSPDALIQAEESGREIVRKMH